MDEDQSGASADPTPNGSVLGIVAIGLLVGLVIAGAVIRFSGGSDEAAPSPTVTAPVTSAPELDGAVDGDAIAEANGDAVDLVVAYGRSRTDDHALIGELLRPDSESVPVRRGIMGSRSIDEVGDTAAVTEDGETRQCELIENQWLCAPPLPQITTDRDVQGFATLFLTEAPTYTVFAVSTEPPGPLQTITELGPVTCWSFVSDGRVDRARFGAETTMCFHNDLGALVGRVTETSAGDDVFVADAISADVGEPDVEPSR